MIKSRDDFWELVSRPRVDVDALSTEELSEAFKHLNDKMQSVYLFALNYGDYINSRHPYTEDGAMTTLEAHLLTDICEVPDSTVTSLACAWNRSVSATSQTIRKLIQKGMITRENSTSDAKIFFLRPTDKGRSISEAHKRYDTLDIIKTIKTLRHELSEQEIEHMFKGLSVFTKLLKKK